MVLLIVAYSKLYGFWLNVLVDSADDITFHLAKIDVFGKHLKKV